MWSSKSPHPHPFSVARDARPEPGHQFSVDESRENPPDGLPGNAEADAPQGIPFDGRMAVDLRQLNTLAFRGLRQMYNPEAELFCHTLKRTASGLERDGVSPRYTIMTLLGLHQLATAGIPAPIPISTTCDRVLKHDQWVKNIGVISASCSG